MKQCSRISKNRDIFRFPEKEFQNQIGTCNKLNILGIYGTCEKFQWQLNSGIGTPVLRRFKLDSTVFDDDSAFFSK